MHRFTQSIGFFLLLTLVGCAPLLGRFPEPNRGLTLFRQDRETDAGIAHLYLSQPLLAWDHFQRVADANSHYSRFSGVGVWTLLGLSNYEMGRFGPAHNNFSRALQEYKNAPLAHLYRGLVMMRQGQTELGNRDVGIALHRISAKLQDEGSFSTERALKEQVDTALATVQHDHSPARSVPQLVRVGGNYLRYVENVNLGVVQQCSAMNYHADTLFRWQEARKREIENQRRLQAKLKEPRKTLKTNGDLPKTADPPRNLQQEAKKDDLPIKNGEIGKPVTSGEEPSAVVQQNSFKNVEARDSNQDGKPDLWVYYNPKRPEEIVRQEEDINADGNVDTWSYFRNGQLVRRESDTRGDGRADMVYHYQNGKMALEERYEEGSGTPTFRAIYQEGWLVKEEKDLDRNGKMDLWRYYDPGKEKQVILKEEKDVDGDGIVDVWSYYKDGQLTHRDVSEAGLKHSGEKESPGQQTSEISLPR
ncbi:MAG: hypothetical protein ACE5HC_05355 [Candidatus Binatia bacterium]